jgi:hypothetical protein
VLNAASPSKRATLTAGDVGGVATVTVSGAACSTNEIQFSVVAPTGVLFQRVGGVEHTQRYVDIGMHSNTYLLPDTVSFVNVFWIETDVKAYATGAWACFDGVGHGPNPIPLRVVAFVPGLGSQLPKRDVEKTGACQYRPPYTPGVEDYPIPQLYSVGADGTRHPIDVVTQAANLTDAGIIKIEKGAANAETTINSPDSNF